MSDEQRSYKMREMAWKRNKMFKHSQHWLNCIHTYVHRELEQNVYLFVNGVRREVECAWNNRKWF